MLSWNVTPDPPRIIGPWFLWKLLIDERHQGRGYGREAVKLVADIARDQGASELLTSYVAGEGAPSLSTDRSASFPQAKRMRKARKSSPYVLVTDHFWGRVIGLGERPLA